jgi:hypothetical protein
MAPFEIPFLTISFIIILMTVVATTAGVVAFERRRKPMGLFETPTASQLTEINAAMKQTRSELERMERDRERRRQEELRKIEKEAKRPRKP